MEDRQQITGRAFLRAREQDDGLGWEFRVEPGGVGCWDFGIELDGGVEDGEHCVVGIAFYLGGVAGDGTVRGDKRKKRGDLVGLAIAEDFVCAPGAEARVGAGQPFGGKFFRFLVERLEDLGGVGL